MVYESLPLFSIVNIFYETLRTNYEALRAMRGHERVEGLVLSTLEKAARNQT